ncbi:MAG TPA: hypothetical protein VFT53_02370 [Candidatus Saccharimonadales bacterium]|nr:hypothetical protein [Candidatus Saccharimonadales bacterium]
MWGTPVEELSPMVGLPNTGAYKAAGFIIHTLYGSHLSAFEHVYGLQENDERLAVAAAIDGMMSGMRPEAMRTILHRLDAYNYVAPRVNQAMDIVRTMAEEDVAALPETIRSDRRTLATADHIAWRVHGQQIRDSGGPYYKHPQAVTAMALHAFAQLRREGYEIPDDQVDAHLTTCFTHDAAEDTNRSRRYFDGPLLAKMLAFSPLEVRYVCMATDNPYGDDVAYSLYMLTRHKLPGRLGYLPYVRRGLHDIGFRVAKSADLQHNNDIDPRPITSETSEETKQKIADKRALYEVVKQIVRAFNPNAPSEGVAVPVNEKGEVAQNPPWEARYHDLIAGVTADQLPGMVAALGTYIYGADLPAHWQYIV